MPDDQQGNRLEAAGIRAYRLDGSGIGRLLGSLETDVLEAVWKLTDDEQSTPDTWTTIGAVASVLGDANYKTTQTVMNRLVEKGLLVRRHRLRAHEYRAAATRDVLVAQTARSILGGLVQDFGDVALAQLLHTLQTVDPDHLEALQRLAATEVPTRQEGDEDE